MTPVHPSSCELPFMGCPYKYTHHRWVHLSGVYLYPRKRPRGPCCFNSVTIRPPMKSRYLRRRSGKLKVPAASSHCTTALVRVESSSRAVTSRNSLNNDSGLVPDVPIPPLPTFLFTNGVSRRLYDQRDTQEATVSNLENPSMNCSLLGRTF